MQIIRSGRRVRFGQFEMDEHAGELRKEGVKVRLQEQPLQILQILLEHAGEVVTREELRKRVWPTDTFVDFDHGINNAIKRLREALADATGPPRYIETLPRRGYRFVEKIQSNEHRVRSVAVLPLENLSRDPEQEYFADGLTEALITSLAKISALRVISRTTAMHYKGVHRPLPEIARELGVEIVVEGSVLRSGERIRISAQFIEACSDTHLWAESYERDLRDVLRLQSEIARAVAVGIQAVLTPGEQEQLAQARPVNPEAYEAYLKGRYYWEKRRPDAVKRGVEYFQLAIEKDPTYAAAYAGLADSAGAAGFWGFAPPAETYAKAKVAAQTSLEIEETAEAHTSLGFALLHYDFDFAAAKKEFERAIELNPNYATAHQWYGHYFGYSGQFDQCLEETTRALRLDPLSLIINTTYAGAFWFRRQWDQAIEHCHKAMELDPSFVGLRWMLANVYEGKGMYSEAISERQYAVELSGGAPVFVAGLGGSYAAAGKKQEALRIREQLQNLSERHYVMAYWIALLHTGVEERDDAFYWLERAYKEKSATFALTKVDPRLDFLRADPRFDDLLHCMKLPV
jgi:TolB-like protein